MSSPHISAVCPQCQSKYQVKPELAGKAMRCTQPGCEKIFVIGGDPKPTPSSKFEPPPVRNPAAKPKQQSGSVLDMMPVVETEAAEAPPKTAETPAEAAPEPRAPEPEAPSNEQELPDWVPSNFVDVKEQEKSKTDPPSEESIPVPQEKVQVKKFSMEDELPPPPVRSGDSPSGNGVQQPEASSPAAPPVRRELDTRVTAPSIQPSSGGTAPSPSTPPPNRGAKWIIVGLLLLVVVGLGGGYLFVSEKFRETEEGLRSEALADYKNGNFVAASEKFTQLPEKFPESAHEKEYLFLKDLSDLRGLLHTPDVATDTGVNQTKKFLTIYADEKILGQYKEDLVKSWLHLVNELIKRSKEKLDLNSRKYLVLIEKAHDSNPTLADAIPQSDHDRIKREFLAIRARLVSFEKQEAEIQDVLDDVKNPTLETLKSTLSKLEELSRQGVSDPRIRQAVQTLFDGLMARVHYEKADTPPAGVRRNEPPVGTSVWNDVTLVSARKEHPAGVEPESEVLFAVSRGVLYACDSLTGNVLWVRRIGIDSTRVPVSIPAGEGRPEGVLVFSSDRQSLLALSLEGKTLWEYVLGRMSLGSPLVHKDRAYLSTFEGDIHEISLADGSSKGKFHVGQRLSGGGVAIPGTSHILFPADDSCVYLLDVTPGSQRCIGILYSNHTSGSLRGEPLLIPAEREDSAGFLILTRIDGLDATELMVFQLPVLGGPGDDRVLSDFPTKGTDFWHLANDQPTRIQSIWTRDPTLIRPELRFRGWTWFPPKSDGEKLSLVTDSGMLGLFGIRQPLNKDPLLFPWLPGSGEGIALDRYLGGTSTSSRGSSGGLSRSRAQLVRARGEDLWALAEGRLQRLRLLWDFRHGLEIVPGWQKPLVIGSPLHESRTFAVPPSETNPASEGLFLCTRGRNRSTPLIHGIDESTGRMLWQHQVGAVVGESVHTSKDGTGGTSLFLADASGGVLQLRPDEWKFDSEWQASGARALAGFDLGSRSKVYTVVAPDGASFYQFVSNREKKTLRVRQFGTDGQGKVSVLGEKTFETEHALTDAPLVGKDLIVLSLEDGALHHLGVPFTAEKAIRFGVNWRFGGTFTRGGHLVALGSKRVLVTDGLRGVRVFERTLDEDIWRWNRLPKNEKNPGLGGPPRPTLELGLSLVASPAVIGEGKSARVLLIDSTNTMTLFSVGADGSLTKVRHWDLDGVATTAPKVFTIGSGDKTVHRVGCIVDRGTLVWFDPDKDDELWRHRARLDTIVGEPSLLDTEPQALLLATQGGGIAALDMEKGTPLGPNYRFSGSMAPATGPGVTGKAGDKRITVAVSDGTFVCFPASALLKKPGD